MSAERTFQLGELLVMVSGEVTYVDKLTDQTSLEDYIQYKCRNFAGRDEEDDPFYVVDLGRVMDRHSRWEASLPNVQPFYAVKCNDDVMLLKILAALGTGFDCASKKEMKIILDLGVSPDRIIYANTIKQISHLKYAAKRGVTLMPFDNDQELHKVKEHYPTARLVLHIAADSTSSPMSYSAKFGCTILEARDLLQTALSLDLNVVGLSFHIGSFGKDPASYQHAMELASEVFHYAASVGYHMTLLDIGGGFPGRKMSDDLFKNMAVNINRNLEVFSDFPDLKVIAEPGFFFACSPYSIAVSVIGKKVTKKSGEDPVYIYTINEGIHGSFRLLSVFQATKPTPVALQETLKSNHHHKTFIWGQTLHCSDIVCEAYMPELNIGDWIYFENMGGYSLCLRTTFNGFNVAPSYYYIRESYSEKLKSLMVQPQKERHIYS